MSIKHHLFLQLWHNENKKLYDFYLYFYDILYWLMDIPFLDEVPLRSCWEVLCCSTVSPVVMTQHISPLLLWLKNTQCLLQVSFIFLIPLELWVYKE